MCAFRSAPRRAVTLAFVLLASHPALAQEVIVPAVPEEVNVVGFAIGTAPDYPGSNDYTLGLAPVARYDFGDHRYVELMAATLGGNLIDHPFLRIGPIVNYRFGRDNVNDSVVDQLTAADDAVEIGVSVGLSFVNEVNERIRFNTKLEVLSDVSGAHDGTLATLSTRYWHPIGRAFDVSLGVSSTYATEGYMDSFFGVSAADSAVSGLTAFTADGGLRDISITPLLVLHLSREWHVGLGLRYQRLLSDAADSPVVDDRGSASQFIAGLGVAYTW